jgi:hypothetical protein
MAVILYENAGGTFKRNLKPCRAVEGEFSTAGIAFSSHGQHLLEGSTECTVYYRERFRKNSQVESFRKINNACVA